MRVLCDRHFGGINYPVGGVGGIAKTLAKCLVAKGSKILYKADVTNIILEHGKAAGVGLSDGKEFFSKAIISNATRWDTFDNQHNLPSSMYVVGLMQK
ncbi:prolycopene isomerase 1, chloroplastic-like [Tasmannia lanceolata]|uniref:prolycopene isomerase 1, chloroplastic-like n=1 Tax=Tasmannia lanceolata TaxID=3420 RepID=UPI00406342D5